jgi:vacuolar-type H+-ATPase subunit D/Vma8
MTSTAGNSPVTSQSDLLWRQGVPQSSRNKEVREIAKILASLEPGATSASKLMLAMRFETGVFSAAGSYDDYKKRLSKRLKKMQKTYTPASRQATPKNDESTSLEQEQSQLALKLDDLKTIYGPTLVFICNNAEAAVAEMQAKSGEEKGKYLKQHTDNAKQWALQLGLLGGPTKIKELAAAEKLALHLEQRVENIRSHVVKLIKPDLFLQETLAKIEAELKDEPAQAMINAALQRLDKVQFCNHASALPVVVQSLEGAQKAIVPPGRSVESQRIAALAHLERLKAASSGLLAYLAVANRHDAPDNILVKCHNAAITGIEYFEEMATSILPDEVVAGVRLEDAWTKVIEEPAVEVTGDNGVVESRRMVFKSRFLLQSQKRPPSSLLVALKRKGAHLVQQPAGGSHVVLEFEQAFFMTIYLSPLLVTVRAGPRNGPATEWPPLETNLSTNQLHIWGVSGSYSILGGVVEARLQHASAQATMVLRTIWSSTLKAKNNFELEAAEGTALLEFVHLARQTYQPNYIDDESFEAEKL